MRQQTAAAIALCLAMISSAYHSSQSTAADEKAGADARMTQEAAKKLKSPVPFSTTSIARGRTLFLRDCKECHGADGKGLILVNEPVQQPRPTQPQTNDEQCRAAKRAAP